MIHSEQGLRWQRDGRGNCAVDLAPTCVAVPRVKHRLVAVKRLSVQPPGGRSAEPQ
jgi:hypothetical protein